MPDTCTCSFGCCNFHPNTYIKEDLKTNLEILETSFSLIKQAIIKYLKQITDLIEEIINKPNNNNPSIYILII